MGRLLIALVLLLLFVCFVSDASGTSDFSPKVISSGKLNRDRKEKMRKVREGDEETPCELQSHSVQVDD